MIVFYIRNKLTGAHGEAGDEGALDELVRVLAHDLAVLAGARLGLVGVNHQKRRPPVRGLFLI